MRTAFLIAFRYFIAKKKNTAVTYLSRIAAIGFLGGAFAMIVILSTLNGFESLIISMYERYDPDFKIENKNGKVLSFDTQLWNQLNATPGLLHLHEVLEDQAVIKHYDYQTAVYVKGVPDNYFYDTQLDSFVQDGLPDLVQNGMPLCILGAGVDFKLQTRVSNPQSVATLYTPRRGNYSINDPDIVQSLLIKPSGVVYLEDQINQKYVFVPLSFAEELFDREAAYSYIEIRVEADKEQIAQKYLQSVLPKDLICHNRIEQQASLYRMFRSEKWVTFALLAFVLLLASFNVTGSISMLIMEKKKDIFTLKTLGASHGFIRSIFLIEGLIISIAGGFVGLLLGSMLVWMQKELGILHMEGAIVENYPVKLLTSDVVLIFGTTIALGFITSLYPAWKSVSNRTS